MAAKKLVAIFLAIGWIQTYKAPYRSRHQRLARVIDHGLPFQYNLQLTSERQLSKALWLLPTRSPARISSFLPNLPRSCLLHFPHSHSPISLPLPPLSHANQLCFFHISALGLRVKSTAGIQVCCLCDPQGYHGVLCRSLPNGPHR